MLLFSDFVEIFVSYLTEIIDMIPNGFVVFVFELSKSVNLERASRLRFSGVR